MVVSTTVCLPAIHCQIAGFSSEEISPATSATSPAATKQRSLFTSSYWRQIDICRSLFAAKQARPKRPTPLGLISRPDFAVEMGVATRVENADYAISWSDPTGDRAAEPLLLDSMPPVDVESREKWGICRGI